jgi:hypothetical protein
LAAKTIYNGGSRNLKMESKYFIESLIVSGVLILFLIISLNIDDRIVAYIGENKEIHYSDEFMSGGEDFVPFMFACVIFLPVTIISIINIFLKKKINMILIITIGVQLFLFHVWLDVGNIWLNLLYGTMKLKLWIIIFSMIISYAILNLILSIKNIFGKN